ncbi:MAG: hypothetical protein DMG32_23480 [Acidobacteria bacterium]|nr:MAG: hypothetical protein DMG32_23480 [Acidobacteriota bacterium]
MRKCLGIVSSALTIGAVLVVFAPIFVAAQSSPGAAKAGVSPAAQASVKSNTNAGGKDQTWVMPRMADGHPDFSGYWNSLTFTPMERPTKYGNREFLTPEEMKGTFRSGVRGSYEPGAQGSEDRYGGELFNPDSVDYDATTYGLSPWQNGIKPNPRTSLVVDPPDGKIPPLTPEAKARLAAGARPGGGFPYVIDDHHGGAVVHADNARDLGQNTSCVTQSGGPPLIPAEYNSGLFIAQNSAYMLIETETGSEFRIIPLDGHEHVSSNIHQWHGDSRGHWEGDTLVVETTNLRPDHTYRNGAPSTQKITEYFKRSSADTIEYKFTVDDPSTWTEPWSAIIPMSASTGPLFEYDCSENNNDAVNILAGARAFEKKTGEGKPISQK